MIFIIAFYSPIQQGQTTYPFMVMEFKRKQKQVIKVQLPEEDRKKLYSGKLKEEYVDELYKTISCLIKYVVGVNVIMPDIGIFQKFILKIICLFVKSSFGNPCFRCSKKANQGLLFPLSKSMIFIHKPVMYIRMSELARVELQRVGRGLSTKMFDFILVKKTGGRETFVGIDKREQDSIINYFQEQGVIVKKIIEDTPNFKNDYYQEDDLDLAPDENTDADEDFVAKDTDSEDDEDYNIDDEKVQNDVTSETPTESK